MDGFCPIGPNILTADKVPDPHNLKISCSVNGQIKQTSSTNQLIHGVYDCISFLSKYVTLLTLRFQPHVNTLTTTRFCTLLPGDIILTGTPPGSGGFAKPPQFLQVHFVVLLPVKKHS